jgi:hypothetical protein
MVKTLKRRSMKKRITKRNKKGGEIINSLAQIKTNNNFILGEIARAEANGDCDFTDIKEVAEEEKKIIEKEIEEQLAKQEESEQKEEQVQNEEPAQNEEPPKVEESSNDEAFGVSSSPVVINEERKEIPLMQQTITINGFTGTVSELLSRMREKVIQLKKNVGNKYKTTIDKLSATARKISSDAIDSVDKIKEILKNDQITFKNNKLFGGKTKKMRNNKKSNRITKRR